MSNQPVYWKQRDGKLISIDSMDINHLRHTLKMIVNNSNKHKEKVVVNNEIDNSAIGRKFKELEVQELMDDYEDMWAYDNGL